jgi:hypothetical protein
MVPALEASTGMGDADSVAYLLIAVGRAESLVHDQDPGHASDQAGDRGG